MGGMVRHGAYVREQPVVGDARRVATGRWELICTTCGDDGGVYADQPGEAKVLRGPYLSEFDAREALRKHVERNR